MTNLRYEQIVLLKTLRESIDIEGHEACNKSQCSYDELYYLSYREFINLGIGRIKKYQLNPFLTQLGKLELNHCIKQGIIK